jgi:hypothetical protein
LSPEGRLRNGARRRLEWTSVSTTKKAHLRLVTPLAKQ